MAESDYQGPGKLYSTIGGWFIGGAVGGLIGTTMIVAFPVAGVFYAALAVGFTCNVVGAYLGYNNAARGKEQYDVLRAKIEARQTETTSEPNQQISTARFTDRFQSKAAEGNYVDTVLAERTNAAPHKG